MTKKILYYNTLETVIDKNQDLPGVAKFGSFYKMFNSAVVVVDRTGTIKTPINTESIFPIPKLRPFTKTFEEICNERAVELLTRAEKLGVTLYAFFSGGIDSTLLVISFLKNATPQQKKNFVVLLSEESIIENPNFYRDHLHGKVRTEPSGMFQHLLGSKHLLVGGEHNDQLFGSDKILELITMFGVETMNKPYSRDTYTQLFNASIQDLKITNFWMDTFEQLRAACPVEVRTNAEFLWWINFSLKWQSVFFRMLTYASPRSLAGINREYLQTQYNHFYGTDDFQLWSLTNMDKKIKGEWNTYKWTCKEIIYDYTKDADYRDNKTKRGSLFFLIQQRDSYNFVDTDAHMYKQLPREEWYLPDNSFI
jgi:hypothetical protein